MPGSRHIILRQTLQWETDRSENRQELAEQLSRIGTAHIPALLEQVLERFDDPACVIRLDAVEIELEYNASVSLERWLEVELEKALYKAIQTAVNKQTSEPQPLALSDLELWLSFLEKGYLPWNAPEKYSVAELEYRISEALATWPELAEQIVEKLQNTLLLQRLLRQFSVQMPWRILETLHTGFEEKYRIKWASMADSGLEKERFALWKTVFVSKGLLPEDIVQKIAQLTNTEQDKTPSPHPVAPSKLPETGVFVQNAGLILLHPYLKTLFEDLSIAQEEKIVHPDKALFALHYALCGKTAAPEWELVLPKILCGIPSNQNTWRSAALDEAECFEVDNMLQAVVDHWEVLKNSSVDGLREAFLQRNGRLTETDDYWTLKVEQKSYDMLLDHLPWGIGIVKLPWMHKPVYTEWI